MLQLELLIIWQVSLVYCIPLDLLLYLHQHNGIRNNNNKKINKQLQYLKVPVKLQQDYRTMLNNCKVAGAFLKLNGMTVFCRKWFGCDKVRSIWNKVKVLPTWYQLQVTTLKDSLVPRKVATQSSFIIRFL